MNQSRISTTLNLWTLGSLLLLSLGFALRLFASTGDLWLDEIWSLNLIKPLNSWVQIFALKIDNNHLLNSSYLYILPKNAASWLYRSFSCACALMLLFLLWKHAHRLKDKFFFILCVFSYPLILYGTEARGYSALLLFSYLCWKLQTDIAASKKPGALQQFFFLSCLVLGFLAHFSFLHLWLALLLLHFFQERQNFLLAGFAKAHLVFAFFLLLFYILYLREMPPGTGNIRAFIDTLTNTLALISGGPLLSPTKIGLSLLAMLSALITLIIISSELSRLKNEDPAQAFFLFCVIFLSPIMFISLSKPHVIFERYFLISIFFSLYAVAGFFSRLGSIGGVFANPILWVMFAYYLLAQNFLNFSLLQFQRGQYTQALLKAKSLSPTEPLSLSGSVSFRDTMLLEYYAPKLDIQYQYQETNLQIIPESAIYLKQSQDPAYNPSFCLKFADSSKNVYYHLVSWYPSAPLSGWHWALYRKIDEAC